ncbi:MAG TPA: prepilin-type N-terminal cleavage/methylation domain-containing protein [Planctomycetota bacterium]|jgi:prepilin-type N-terminal cleavage/methylation domain-containing protein
MRHPAGERLRRAGFTLIEVLVVVSIILLLMGLLLPTIAKLPGRSRARAAKMFIEGELAIALEAYRTDFGSYPPHDQPLGSLGMPSTIPGQGGSQVLAYYLCRRHKWGDMGYGPYIRNAGERLRDGINPEKKLLISPLGGCYMYSVLTDPNVKGHQRCLVVDPGPDKQFGGEIDPIAGWKADGSGFEKDNLFTEVPR